MSRLDVKWSQLQPLIAPHKLKLQYFEQTEDYFVFAMEAVNNLQLTTRVDKTATRNADQISFEDNYKSGANAFISPEVDVFAGRNRLLVDDQRVLDAILNLSGITPVGAIADIVISSEFTLTAKVETDVPSVTYTVTAGKTFYLVSFAATSNSPSPSSFRLKVANVTKKKLELGASNGSTTGQLVYPNAAKLAVGGQVVKVTYDAQLNRGGGWTEFVGLEI